MAEPHVVTALVRKRAEIGRAIEAAERYLRRLRADLTHVDAVLRLYGPDGGGAGPDGIPHDLLPRPAALRQQLHGLALERAREPTSRPGHVSLRVLNRSALTTHPARRGKLTVQSTVDLLATARLQHNPPPGGTANRRRRPRLCLSHFR